MTKFSNAPARPPRGPLTTRVTETGLYAVTHEGGVGFEQDPKTALFTLGVTNMVGETTFYESAADRDNRFRALVHIVAVEDPAWLLNYITFLRGEANMRSASVVAAVEFAIATAGDSDGWGRRAIVAACERADEPAEALGYFLATYGRQVPMAVKRGIADAAVKLYTEKAAIKYDGGSRGVRMGDVIELTHPKPKADWQSRLFKYLLDKRHGHLEGAPPEDLPTLASAYRVDSAPQDERRSLLRRVGPDLLADSGYTWERLSGWLNGPLDAEAWEAVIPSMGYMALLRNLRNFEQAKVSSTVLDVVSARIADPAEVAQSRQFPFRFLSAYLNTGDRFTHPISQALEASVLNVPKLSGRTLVMVDTSGSMQAPLSAKSTVPRVDVAALFGATVAATSDVDIWTYAQGKARFGKELSVLRSLVTMRGMIGMVGHATNTWPMTAEAYNGHDRIIIFTDEQAHWSRLSASSFPADVPIYVWNLAGYEASSIDTSVPNRYLFGGFSDACFRLIGLLEAGRNAGWPWET